MTGKKTKKDIRTIGEEELERWFLNRGWEAYRARQVYQWLWNQFAGSFDAMSNLPKKIREALKDAFYIAQTTIEHAEESKDGTVKYLFRMEGNVHVEGVLIPSGKRLTACLSSQAGCGLGCRFCATGKMGLIRNLKSSEIVDEACLMMQDAYKRFGIGISNIVLMGMGEPLQNYNNVLQALYHIHHPGGLNFSSRRVTLSTVGLSRMIEQLAEENAPCELAVSLHAADDQKRKRIIPAAMNNSISDLIKSLNYYFDKTKKTVTIEYILFRDFNDCREDAESLAKISKRLHCKINIIEFNPVRGVPFRRSTEKKTKEFMRILSGRRIPVTRRESRGMDILAACGQLADNNLKT